HVACLVVQQVRLPFYSLQHSPSDPNIDCRDVYDDPLRSYEPWQRTINGFILVIAGAGLEFYFGQRWVYNHMRWDCPLTLLSILSLCVGCGVLAFGHLWPPKRVCTEQDSP